MHTKHNLHQQYFSPISTAWQRECHWWCSPLSLAVYWGAMNKLALFPFKFYLLFYSFEHDEFMERFFCHFLFISMKKNQILYHVRSDYKFFLELTLILIPLHTLSQIRCEEFFFLELPETVNLEASSYFSSEPIDIYGIFISLSNCIWKIQICS